jgi:hypothetical protein
MAPPPPPSPRPTEADLLALIRAHGSSIMAYSKLQPGLEHFYVPELPGAVSYCVMQVGPPFLFKFRPVALGDPLCAPEHRERLTRLFLEKHPRSFFVQVSRDYALLLQRVFGLKATCMGGETELDVAGGYDLTGQAKHPLRNAAAAAEREGVWVEELRSAAGADSAISPSSCSASLLESEEVQQGLRAVDAAWATTKGAHHAARIWFINRAPVFGAEPGVRKFVAWQQKQGPNATTTDRDSREMVAYIFFDPVFEGGRLKGVYANVTRISPEAPPGCLNLIMREALKKFRSELESEAQQLKEEAARKNKAAAADDNDDDLAARDQSEQEQQPQQKLTRKERLALKAAALAARGVSAEELRAQRAAKKEQQAAVAASGGRRGKDRRQPQVTQERAPKPTPTNTTDTNTKNTKNTQNTNLPPFFVSLGMAPFFALSGDGGVGTGPVDPELPGERSATRVMGWVYEHGQTFYPYKAIAFSKTRYGGGLDEGTWTFPRDKAARWRPVYAASSLDAPTFVALFDLGALVGFWKGPFNAIATFVRYEWSGLKARVAARLEGSRRRRRGAGGKEGEGGADGAPLAAFGGAAAATRGPPVSAPPVLAAFGADTVATPAPPVSPPPPPVLAAPAPPPAPSVSSAASAPGSVVTDAVASVEDCDGDGDGAPPVAVKGAAAPDAPAAIAACPFAVPQAAVAAA